MSESFAELFEESLKTVDMEPGSIVTGVVIDIDNEWVTVHAGLKSEGVIPRAQFNDAAGDPSAPQVGGTMPYASRKFGFDSQWLQDYIYMRAAELYLTEAEAYARLGKTSEAQAVMEELMETRDPLWAKTATLEEITLQRRIELWGEGFRYFDLRRTATGIVRDYEGSNHNYELMTIAANVPAHDVLWLFQIPQAEMQENTELSESDQND